VVVNASGAAALAGVQPGDIVLAVNGQPVRTAAELRETVRTGDRKIVELLVERERSQIFIPVPVEE
jgi:serine protease Do